MAEKIVSPGVFTREKDLSFLPQGVAEIGACVIGATRKGPAFVPTLCDSFADFETKFGAVWDESYVPFTVQQYMKSAGQVTIVRVLGERGHIINNQIGFKLGQDADAIIATGSFDLSGFDAHTAGRQFYVKYGGSTYTFELDAENSAGEVSTDVPEAKYYFFSTGSGAATSIENLKAEINAKLSFVEAARSSTTLELTASAGGTNGNTITFGSGSTDKGKAGVAIGGGVDAVGGTLVAVGAPVKGEGSGPSGTDQYAASYATTTANDQVYFDIDGSNKSTISAGDSASKRHFTLSSSVAYSVDGAAQVKAHYYTASFGSSDSNSLTNIFGEDKDGNQPMYLYVNFKDKANELKDSTPYIEKVNLDFDAQSYSEASTPSILSQDGATLFTVKTLSHGSNANEEIKISISNIKWPGSVPGSDYGSFNLQVRKYKDGSAFETDLRPVILEQYNNVSLDPDSPSYFPKMIGDRYMTVDSAGKITLNGDWPNKSKYIRVDNYKPAAPLKNHIPWGFSAYKVPFDGESSTTTAIPAISTVTAQESDSQYNSRVHFGVDFSSHDTREYHKPIPTLAVSENATGSNVAFSLNGCTSDGKTLAYGDAAASPIAARQFSVGFQGGYDGFAPQRVVKTGGEILNANTQGWDLSGVTDSTDYNAFKKAISAVSNPDEFDINMLVIPGVDATNHSSVVTYAKNMCEDRGDTFYIMDLASYGNSIANVTSTATSYDTNYAAVYYPWVRILDTSTGKLIWVPPSVVMAGVIAFTDKVSHEWFAPAGLLRGGLSDVIEAETRLTHDERDELYENRVNPIATFPGQGVCVWGQKTLQGKPSALDRVNVRRLLIKLKKFIASSTKFLVFEQNTAATRNRFLNIVNPFLEQVQQNSGLSAFKVVMDETNNTPDLIDRNILFGQIFIQPTRTAEFIILDFNIMPTGATFPE